MPISRILYDLTNTFFEGSGRYNSKVGCDVMPEFMKAVMDVKDLEWQAIYKEFDRGRIKTNQEWAEICFIPNAIGHSKDSFVYRYLAIREAMGSMDLPGMESSQQSLPFPTLQMSSQQYKLFGLVTNMRWEGEELIHWHRERCGKRRRRTR